MYSIKTFRPSFWSRISSHKGFSEPYKLPGKQSSWKIRLFMHKRARDITILRRFFCLTVPKYFVEEPFCAVFQKISDAEKV